MTLHDDYETIIEICMLAGTHYLNAALHDVKLTTEVGDLLHSDKPEINFQIPSWLQPAFVSMKFIEDLRPPFVRGAEPFDVKYAERCLREYRAVKELCSGSGARS